jgi:hypothetical protein
VDRYQLDIFKNGLGAQQFVDRSWLVEHWYRQDDEHIYYRPCLVCGTDDHGLMERRDAGDLGRALVAYCPIVLKVLIIQEPDIIGIIEKEERGFRALLDKWEGKIPPTLTPQEAFRLRTEQGVPFELLEDRVQDASLLAALFEQHRMQSGSKFRETIF